MVAHIIQLEYKVSSFFSGTCSSVILIQLLAAQITYQLFPILYVAFQSTTGSKVFTGLQLASLLDIILSLPEGAETDLLQNSDR